MTNSPRRQSLIGFEDPVDLHENLPPKREIAETGGKTTKRESAQPEDLSGRTVYVVDSHSLIFQVFHALPEMTSPGGQPVGAVYGFTRDILFLLQEKKPDYLFCAFDLPGLTFRHQMYDRYKIDRSEMPESLQPQIPNIRRILKAMGIVMLDCPNYEADDILATLAKKVDRMQGQCFLVTGDKDCRQLITDNVSVYNIRKDETFDAKDLMDTWGIRPDQVVDFQSLVGDSVDNVPGVALIGPKIARELLEKYDTLETVLDQAGELSGKKRRQNLLEGREVAMLSRDLVRLVDDVPVEIDWNSAQAREIDTEEVSELCREFGFRSFVEQINNLHENHIPSQWEADYQAVTTPEQLKSFVAELSEQKRVSLDTETTSANPRWAEIVGYSFCWEEGKAYYLPVKTPPGEPCLDPNDTLEMLRPILENPQIEKIGQNIKYDMIVLRNVGVKLQGVFFDTMVADYLLEAGARNHGLNELSQRYLNHTPIKISELIGTGKKQLRMDQVAVDEITPYAAEDADVPLRLIPYLGGRLKEDGIEALFQDLEVPLIEVLVELEYNGIRVDIDRLGQLSREYGKRMDVLEHEIYEIANQEFNIASPKQLAGVLFDELKLPVIKKTKTGPSTDVEVLDRLAKLHPLPAKIIEFRQYAKLKGTYLDALPELVHPKTGRVHTSLNQVVAATGRLSSNNPNLQNIPIRTKTGREIRSAFIPGEESWQLMTADYSQIELRVLAHYSRDDTLLASFSEDEDIHARVAGEVYEVPLEEVTSEMRRNAKAINFGVIYGQSPFGLAKSLDIEQEEAAQFIDSYFKRYPEVDRLLELILDECKANGYVSTILGRRRAIQGIRDSSKRGIGSRQKNLPERTAINTVIQGSAADLIKRAMLNVHRLLEESPLRSKMLLQIHDELIFEAPQEELKELAELVNQGMIGAAELAVPLKVDIKSGSNWAACEPFDG